MGYVKLSLSQQIEFTNFTSGIIAIHLVSVHHEGLSRLLAEYYWYVHIAHLTSADLLFAANKTLSSFLEASKSSNRS